MVENGNWAEAFDNQCNNLIGLADQLTQSGVRLFNNLEFLEWVTESQNPYINPALPGITNDDPLPLAISSIFLTSGGACPFVTGDCFSNAVYTLF